MNKWIFNSAVTIGKSHTKNHLNCQDDLAILSKNNVDVMVLSDGMGSSTISENGAKITVDTLSNLFVEKFDEFYEKSELQIKKEIIAILIQALNKFASDHRALFNKIKHDRKDLVEKVQNRFFSLYLLNATVQFVAKKGNKVLLGRLGDGVILGIKDKKAIILSSEDKYNIEDNETFYPSSIFAAFEDDPTIFDHFEIQKLDDVSDYSAFIISSDGLENILISDQFDNKYCDANRINKILNTKDLQNLVENEYRNYKGIYDDLSIVTMALKDHPIDGVVVREYDSENRTIDNTAIIDVVLEPEVEEPEPVKETAETSKKSKKEKPDLDVAKDIVMGELEKLKLDGNTLESIENISQDKQTKKIEKPTYINELIEYIGIEKYEDCVKFFRNENLMNNFFKISCKLIKILRDKISNAYLTFDDIKRYCPEDVNDLDLIIYCMYWELTGIFHVDNTKKTISE